MKSYKILDVPREECLGCLSRVTKLLVFNFTDFMKFLISYIIYNFWSFNNSCKFCGILYFE